MRYSKPLDALRFFAVMLVLADHFAHPLGSRISAGYAGVTLFFVLSGFLITRRLLDYSGGFFFAYRRFTARRMVRIFPSYYLLILVLLIGGYAYAKDYIWYCLSHTYNYAMVYYRVPYNAITHLWTLGVEEQFYLLWPLPVLLLRKNKSILLAGTIFAVCICFLQFYFKLFKPLVPYAWVGLIPQFQSLGIGAAGAVFFHQREITGRFFYSSFAEWMIAGCLIFLMVTQFPVKFVIWPLLCLFWVVKGYHGCITNGWFKWLSRQRLLVAGGTMSYGIYLYHLPVYYFFKSHIYPYLGYYHNHHEYLLDFPVCTFITLVLAWTSYHFLELPLKKWKDRRLPYDNLQ